MTLKNSGVLQHCDVDLPFSMLDMRNVGPSSDLDLVSTLHSLRNVLPEATTFFSSDMCTLHLHAGPTREVTLDIVETYSSEEKKKAQLSARRFSSSGRTPCSPVSPKRWYPPTRQHDVTTQKSTISTTSNLCKGGLCSHT
jgi:hypothetical protein